VNNTFPHGAPLQIGDHLMSSHAQPWWLWPAAAVALVENAKVGSMTYTEKIRISS
jgi:hypothetical protein